MAGLLPSPKFQAFDGNGAPLVGGKVHTYEPGTTTNKATYTDSTKDTANANPVILDARGEASIWWDGGYKVVLKDADDNTIYTVDNYGGAVAGNFAVYATKAAVAALSLSSGDAGTKIFITSDDGGEFTIRYNATPGTYADNGNSSCGTLFIPSGGDGTIGIERDFDGVTIHDEWFGVTGDGSTDDTSAITTMAAAGTVLKFRNGKTYKITSLLTFTSKLVDFDGATVECTGVTNTFAIVVNVTDTYKHGIKNLTLACTNTTTTTHGLCIGGSNGICHNIRFEGLTGVAFGLGSGTETYTSVSFPSTQQCYYWDIKNINFALTAGYGLVIKASNNANSFYNISSFPYNGFGDYRNNCIHDCIIDGIGNTFGRVSFEASPSSERIVFYTNANANEFLGKVWFEENGSYSSVPYPMVSAVTTSSANKLRVRSSGQTGPETFSDLGTANEFEADLAYYINTSQELMPQGFDQTLINNGDFENGTTDWTDSSTSTVTTVVGGFIRGKALQCVCTSGRPNISQDIEDFGGISIVDLANAGVNLTAGVWINNDTDVTDVKIRVNGYTGLTTSPNDGEWYFITTTTKLQPGDTTVGIQLISESSSITGTVKFSNVTCVIGTKALALAPITEPKGSATYDPPSLADGAGATTTVTVTGAELGDYATASFSLDLQGITLTSWVSAADTVSVRFQNESGGVLDLASGTLNAKVKKV